MLIVCIPNQPFYLYQKDIGIFALTFGGVVWSTNEHHNEPVSTVVFGRCAKWLQHHLFLKDLVPFNFVFQGCFRDGELQISSPPVQDNHTTTAGLRNAL